MNIVVATAHTVKIVEWEDTQTAIGKTAAAASDPAETRSTQQTNIIKTSMATMPAAGAIIKKQPAAVATPFPPSLNFK